MSKQKDKHKHKDKDKREEKGHGHRGGSASSSKLTLAQLNALDPNIRVTPKYVLFYHGWLSQFYASSMTIDGVSFFCCEQYMMAMKAKLFKDESHYDLIMQEKAKPAKCKSYGRKVRNFDENTWKKHRETIIYKGNHAKYTQSEELQKLLFKFGGSDRTFVECAPRDSIYGIGLTVQDTRADDSKNWKGSNLLGKAITKVRDDILKQTSDKSGK